MAFLRSLIAVTLLGMMGSAVAQLKVGNMTRLSAAGTIGAGYSGGYTDAANSSSHGVSVIGEGDLSGYYYSPAFLNFDVHPYYGRTQESTDSVSIGTNSGINSTANIFTGSPFPGSATFSKSKENTGQYAVPGSSSLVTLSNSTGYGISWGENLTGLPSLSVGFSHGDSSGSIVGIQGTNTSHTTSFNVASSYRLQGWPINASYSHQSSSSEVPATLTGTGSSQGGGGSSLQLMTNRRLGFWNSSLGAGYSFSDFSFTANDSSGGTQTGASKSNGVSAGFGFSPAGNISSNLQFNYDQNLLNSTVLQVVNEGGVPTTSSSGPLRSLSYSGSVSWNAPYRFLLTGGALRSQQFYNGVEFDSTAAYGNVNYSYERPLFGSIYLTAGMNDSATKDGNTGAGFYGSATFMRQIEGFNVSASLGYSQNLQTVATFITTSGTTYNAGVSRKIWHRTNWHFNFSGGHSGFTAGAGQNHSERFNTGFSLRRIAVSAFWGQAHQDVIQTTAGLIDPGVPVTLLGSSLLVYSSTNYGISGSVTPIKRMTLTAAYAKGRGESTTSDSLLRNDSTVEYMLLRYPYRRIYFTASYNRVLQGIVTAGNPLHPVTSYSFGVYRSIKFF